MRSCINEAKITKRYNTGDYEFEEYTLGAIVDEKESGAEVLQELKKQINEAFTGSVSTEKPKQDKKESKKEEKKNATAKTSNVDDGSDDDEDAAIEVPANDDEGTEDDEAAVNEDNDGGDDSSDDAEDEEAEEVAKPVKEKKGGHKKKPQNYNRSIEQHKEIFSGILKSVAPEWKKTDASKAKAKSASESMEGLPFLDDEGNVLESFKTKVSAHMNSQAKKAK